MIAANVHVLASVYNEESFLDYSLRSYIPYVKSVTIVEGAYKESIALGASPRSSDKTLQIADKHVSSKVQLIQANQKSDAQQRNVGLERIKAKDPYGWLLIVDGDEIYSPITFRLINALTRKMDYCDARAAYFQSLTFVNDFEHFTRQEFPRLFRLTPDCSFYNDNYLNWGDGTPFSLPHVIKAPNIKFFHYSFCKGAERFDLKKQWWETRFGRPFEYSWHRDDDGKITDKHHKIEAFSGAHPEIMKGHPLWPTTTKS